MFHEHFSYTADDKYGTTRNILITILIIIADDKVTRVSFFVLGTLDFSASFCTSVYLWTSCTWKHV